jgi:hypothetical protein
MGGPGPDSGTWDSTKLNCHPDRSRFSGGGKDPLFPLSLFPSFPLSLFPLSPCPLSLVPPLPLCPKNSAISQIGKILSRPPTCGKLRNPIIPKEKKLLRSLHIISTQSGTLKTYSRKKRTHRGAASSHGAFVRFMGDRYGSLPHTLQTDSAFRASGHPSRTSTCGPAAQMRWKFIARRAQFARLGRGVFRAVSGDTASASALGASSGEPLNYRPET